MKKIIISITRSLISVILITSATQLLEAKGSKGSKGNNSSKKHTPAQAHNNKHDNKNAHNKENNKPNTHTNAQTNHPQNINRAGARGYTGAHTGFYGNRNNTGLRNAGIATGAAFVAGAALTSNSGGVAIIPENNTQDDTENSSNSDNSNDSSN
jgi:hypothetical protein